MSFWERVGFLSEATGVEAQIIKGVEHPHIIQLQRIKPNIKARVFNSIPVTVSRGPKVTVNTNSCAAHDQVADLVLI